MRIPRCGFGVVVCALAAALAGCGRGLIYTDMTYPIVDNMNATKVGSKSGTVKMDEVRVPLGRGNISAAWRTRAIGDAAKAGGLETVHYADERTVSVLGGIWRRRTVTVYGD